MSSNIDNKKERQELDDAIKEAKEELQQMFTKKETMIKRLGVAYENIGRNQESICEEIKNALKDEIEKGLISGRLIELYCPNKWKRKTRPKKHQHNEESSIYEQKDTQSTKVETGGREIPEAQNCDDIGPNFSHTEHEYENMVLVEIPDSDIKNKELDRGKYSRFEISILTEVLRRYTALAFDERHDINKILIYGWIDRTTSKVTAACVRRDFEF